ncbi:MAG: flagellar hook-length control protein FliK [Betaproteobacteria bacterium]|nr:flagellar hook-length control protein FliK [Betaproteobacteria bacterium]
METLPVTSSPIAPGGARGSPAEATGEFEALPWAVALQAAFTQHAKGGKPAGLPGMSAGDAVDADDPANAAVNEDEADEMTAAATALDAGAAGTPLAVLAALLPAVPTAPQSAGDVKQDARAADAPAAPAISAAVPAGTAPTASLEAAPAQKPAPEAAGEAATVMRLAEHPATPEGNRLEAGRDAPPLPLAPLTPAHATPPAAAPAPQAAQLQKLQINAVVGSAAWGSELGQKVVWMIGEKQHVAELRVNPPELGPLDIKLTINEHHTTAVFTSPHGAVRDAVEASLPRLREVLAESGVMLGNASVTADTPRDGAAFATPQDHARRGNSNIPVQEPGAPGAPLVTTLPTRRRGLVDLFA